MKTLSRFLPVATVIAALGLSSQPSPAQDRNADKIGGFTVGCAAYTFREGTAFEAIDKTKACGGNVIEFFAWQKLSAETGDVKLNVDLSDEHIKLLKAKLKDAGVKAVNAYVDNTHFVAGSKDETAPRKVFEFARRLGLKGLTGEPPEDQLDIVEKLAKEYNVQFHIHNHRQDAKKPEYKYWDPAYVATVVKNRDRRIGVCMDTGHLVRSNIKPAEAVKIPGDRILSLHLKDPKEFSPDAVDQPFGQGVGDVKGVLAELKRVGFKGHIAVEYENLSPRLLDDVKQCIEFVREEGGKIPAGKKKASKKKAT